MNFEVRALNPDLFDRYMQLRQQVNPTTECPLHGGRGAAGAQLRGVVRPGGDHHLPVRHRPHRTFGVRAADRQLSPGGSPDEGRVPDLRTTDDLLLRHRHLYLILSQEPAGSAALFLTGGLSLIVGTYFRFVARRLEAPRPEDNPGGEISDGAGDVGFFSPGSYWPVILAGAVALTAISLAFMYFWAIAISAILLLIGRRWAAVRVPRPPGRPLSSG